MEEEIIKKSFCNYCINEGNDCMKIQSKEENKIKIYKCINYKKDLIHFNNNEKNSRT